MRAGRCTGSLAALLAAVAAACGGADGPAATRPGPTPVDSTAPATLQVPDTIRFTSFGQSIYPDARLFDYRGRQLDLPSPRWRSENDSVVRVLQPPGSVAGLVSLRPGATRVIATVDRAQGGALADTAWAVFAPVYWRLALLHPPSALLVGQSAEIDAYVYDSAGTMRAIPAALRAEMVWRSTRPDVVRVDERGRMTGVSRGNAVVEATIPSLGVRDTALVGVTRAVDLPRVQWLLDNSGPGDGRIHDVAASPDGKTLYVHYERFRTGQIRAFTSGGKELWLRDTGRNASLRAAGRDGTLYYEDRGLHAVRPDGTERWAVARCTGAVALASDETVYCADSSAVHAVSRDGSARWRRESPGARWLAATSENRVYAVEESGAVTAISRDGAVLWRRPMPTPQDAVMSLAVDAEGALYLSYRGRRTEAIAPDGTARWEIPGVRGELAIGPDRTLILARELGIVSSVRLTDGVERWSIQDFAIGDGAPYVGSSGRLYLATGCWIHALDARTGEVFGRAAWDLCGGVLRHRLVAGRLYLGGYYWQLPTPDEGPGSEWSQPEGNAAKSWRAEP